MEDIGKLHGNPMFPKGNMRETTRKPGFPNVNIRETTWKSRYSPCKHKGNLMEPHISHRFPKIGNYSAPVSRIPRCGNSMKVHVSYKEICGKPHGNPGFQLSWTIDDHKSMSFEYWWS